MPLRYLGVLLIFLASTVLGFALAGSEQSKLRNNDGLIALLRHIRQKIGFFKSTPGEIYASFENRDLEKAGFCEVLCKMGLEEALIRVDCFDLDENCENALRDFAGQIGKSPLGEQISGCDYLLELLEANQKRLCEEYPAKRKVYSSLGMLLGTMAVLLLF